MSDKPAKVVRGRAVRGVDPGSVEELEQLLLHTDCLAGLYYPTVAGENEYGVREVSADGSLPVPPKELWHWYGDTEDVYLNSGRAQAEKFKSLAERYGVTLGPESRVLDFGCSGGRMTRWFEREARNGTAVWGCDIDAAAIEWCQKNMMPPFRFFTNTTSPHIPVPDSYFDMIFAGSVFTHIKDMSMAWLMELSRCTGPDGVCLFTITDEHSLGRLREMVEKRGSAAPKGAQYVVENDITEEFLHERGVLTRDSSPWWLGVLYSSRFFARRASAAFEVLDIIPDFFGFQTGVVLRPVW